MKITLSDYGPIISNKDIGNEIYQVITKALKSNPQVEVDLSDVISMATYCAKQIFGKLYLELGSENFFKRIKLTNTPKDLQLIIKMGIQSAIEDSNNL